MEIRKLYEWEPWIWEHVVVYEVGPYQITNFSEGLKPFIYEWLELMPEDVIYFDKEIKLIKSSEISLLGLSRMHDRKKRLQAEYVASERAVRGGVSTSSPF